MVGETITDPENPTPLPATEIDPPTLSMNFIANTSPFAGREGQFVTSRHIGDRLQREILSDVALVVEDMQGGAGFKVSGRGELHLSILVEKMRREGYEFQVTRPKVIFKQGKDGEMLEPYEELSVDVEEKYQGSVIENLGNRKGQMLDMQKTEGTMVRLIYKIPTRGLLGFRSEFMTDTKGMGVMNYVFLEYGPFAGEMRNRMNGVLVSMEQGTTVTFALFTLQERGQLFMGPGEEVYVGQIVGEHSRDNDLTVNPCKTKKLTNIRSKSADEHLVLDQFRDMSLEDCLEYINDDELVEVTPKSIRLRKMPK